MAPVVTPETGRLDAMTARLIVPAFVLCFAATHTSDVTGNWAVTISAADGEITGTASLKQAREKVTGHIGPVDDATIPVEGVLNAHQLTLKTSHDPAGQPLSIPAS
jgi:hypothetical protein